MNTVKTVVKSSATFLALAMMSTSSARAELLAYDSFDYPLGSLNGQNGGIGWGGAWAGFNGVAGLSYSGLPTAGGAASGDGQVLRSLANPILSSAGGSIYISMLVNQSSANFCNLAFFDNGGAGEIWSFGDAWNGSGASPDYALSSANGANKFNAVGGDFHGSGINIVPNTTQLLVAQLDFTGATPVAYLYLNPALDAAPLTSSAIASMTAGNGFSFNQIRLENRNFPMDEIRIATTFTEAVGVPEPGTGALAVLGLGCLFGFKNLKRRQQVG